MARPVQITCPGCGEKREALNCDDCHGQMFWRGHKAVCIGCKTERTYFRCSECNDGKKWSIWEWGKNY